MTPEKQIDSKATSSTDKADDHMAKLHTDAYSATGAIAPPKDAPAKPTESWLGHAYDWAAGAADVGTQVVVGAATKAYTAIKDHPLDTAVTLAEGAVVGVALIAAAPAIGALGFGAGVVAGVGVVAEAAMTGLAAEGLVSVVKDGVAASQGAAGAADVLMHKSDHSQAEIEAARKEVQAKTGDAALEAAGSATLALGFAGSVIKSGSKIAAIVKSSMEASSDTKIGAAALPELTLIGHEQPALAIKKSSEITKTKTFEKDASESTKLPSKAAVIKFSDRIADYIGERNEKVDLPSLMERKTKLLAEQQTTLEPIAAKAELQKTTEQIDKELTVRRAGFAKIFNGEKEKLFQGEIVPKIKVEALPADSDALAQYKKGSIFLDDDSFVFGDHLHRMVDGDKVTENMMHEAKHAEQDALIVRKYIDKELGSDISGRLSKDAVMRVAKKVFKVDDERSRELVEDVNKQRDGRLLTDSERARADRLEDSKRENAARYYGPDPQEHSASLQQTYKEFFGTSAPKSERLVSKIFDDDDHYYETFSKSAETLEELKSEYDWSKRFGTEAELDKIAKAAAPALKTALLEEISTAQYAFTNQDLIYKAMAHEKEAYAVGEAAASFLPSSDFLATLMTLYK